MQPIYFAIKQIIKKPSYLFLCVGIAVAFFALFIAIPVFTIPGNNLVFQLSIFRTQDYALMIFLAVLVGLNIAMQAYIWKKQRERGDISQSVVQGTVSGAMGIFGTVVGTAACASCLASLFGLIGLGTGSVFFVLKNQPYFLLGAVLLMLISLYFVAIKINRVCNSC
jgi:hypothetical protein